jgi:hypothetical protein
MLQHHFHSLPVLRNIPMEACLKSETVHYAELSKQDYSRSL